MTLLALAFSLLLAGGPPRPALAPADTDTVAVDVGEVVSDVAEGAGGVAENVRRMRIRPVVSPSALYSVSKGFGLGGGIAVSDVLGRGDHLQIEARLAERLQGAYGEYRTGRADTDPLFVLLGAAAWTTDRTRFAGHSPHSNADGDLFLDRSVALAEARLGWSPAGPGGVLLQPALRLRMDRLRGFEEANPGSLERVREEDLRRLDTLQQDRRLGAEVALAVVRDTRNIRARPSRGSYLQAEVSRFQTLDGSKLGFTRVQATGYAFRPALIRLPFLPERGALFVRANGVVTRDDGEDPLPWVYLPEAERDLLVGYPRSEFVGRDALSLGVGARGVIAEAIGAFLVEGVAMGIVGAAYDDVFREFTPRVRFDGARVPDGERVPLSPSVAVGLNLHFLDRERPIVGVLVGAGPQGISLASLRLVYGLRDFRPRFR